MRTANAMRRRKGEQKWHFLLRAHDAEGKLVFGKRWNGANIGWSQTDTGICSKVYGSHLQYLDTNLTDDGNEVEHTMIN